MSFRSLFVSILAGLLICSFGYGQLPSQNGSNTQQPDSSENIAELNANAEEVMHSNPQRSIELAEKALDLSIKSENKNGEVMASITLGKVLKSLKKYEESTDYFSKALKIYSKAKSKEGMAFCYNMLGGVDKERNQYTSAINKFDSALKIYRKLNDRENEYFILSNIAGVYLKMNEHKKAGEFLVSAYELIKDNSNDAEKAGLLNEIGACFGNWGNYGEAIKYLNSARELADKTGDGQLSDAIAVNIRNIEFNMANKDSIQTSYDVEEKDKNERMITVLQGENTEIRKENLKTLEEIEKLSFENQAKELKLNLIQEQYEKEQLENKLKEREIKLLNTENRLSQAELTEKKQKLKTQRTISISVIIGAVLIFATLVIILQLLKRIRKAYRKLRRKHGEIVKMNNWIQMQNNQIIDINTELEKKNQEIFSSIRYAKDIQDSLLPPVSSIRKLFPESFVLFLPRDIVSGDFYWQYSRNGYQWLAIADCTGHGVPGAFMSLIGHNLLNKIMERNKAGTPAGVLKELNQELTNVLSHNKDREDLIDGIDISLCRINVKSQKVLLSCANHTAYIIRNNDITFIDGDIYSIGGMFAGNPDVRYTDHEIELLQGMTLYMFTDGFADQFGGKNNKKYMKERMLHKLIEIQDHKPEIQHNLLKEEFRNWQGENKQIDDVLIAGIKFDNMIQITQESGKSDIEDVLYRVSGVIRN